MRGASTRHHHWAIGSSRSRLPCSSSLSPFIVFSGTGTITEQYLPGRLAHMNSPDNDADQWQGLELISRGAHRVCARDPDHPGLCLKFELPPAERTRVGARQTLRRWLALRFPDMGDNRTELRAYRKLRARLGSRSDGKLTVCHDVVATPRGDALCCDCVLLADGTPASSLYRHVFVDPRYSAETLCAAVDVFEQWLLDNEIPLFDLNAGNFVVVPKAQGVALVCIDVKSVVGGKEILPFSRWSKRLMRNKIARRAQRLRQRIMAALPTAPALAGRHLPH